MDIRKNCIAADHGYNRLYSLGGQDNSNKKRSEVYYYTISSNSWSLHSNLMWTSMSDIACDIVIQKDGTRLILAVTGVYYGRVIYYDLTKNNGWHHQSTLYGHEHDHPDPFTHLPHGGTLTKTRCQHKQLLEISL